MRTVLDAAKTPVTLLVLLAILGFGFWWGWQQVTTPIPPKPPEPCVTQTVPDGVLRASQVTVRVYNGGSVSGRAAKIGVDLRAKGFKVPTVTNTEERIEKTVIVGASADNPEVKLVASFFKDATIKADNRPDHTVDVLVGNQYGGFNANAANSMKVPGNVVCLPKESVPPGASVAPSANNT